MNTIENKFMPIPKFWCDGETYEAYCDRLDQALDSITSLKKPPRAAVLALAFVCMEVPADFDWGCLPGKDLKCRVSGFLIRLSEKSREIFRTEAQNLSRRNDGRISYLLQIE